MGRPRIGVIGTGSMGRNHVRVLDKLGCLAAVTDFDEKLAKEQGEKYNVPFFSDYKQMIIDEKLDGVIVSTPTNTHFTFFEDLLKNTSVKGILIEKPAVETEKELYKLKELLANDDLTEGRILMTGHSEIYNPTIQGIVQLVRDGSIGDIKSLTFTRCGPTPDIRLLSLSNVISDLGTHDISILSELISGEFNVVSAGTVKNDKLNSAHLMFYNDDCVASCYLSLNYALRIRTLKIEGTTGSLFADLISQQVEYRVLSIAKGEATNLKIPIREGGSSFKYYGEPLMDEVSDFISSIQNGEPVTELRKAIPVLQSVFQAVKAWEDKEIKKAHF
ncbi:MAG: Gfo/Idh/MocA family protein [Candidatus Kariarchaeaceae archaeon]